MTSEPPTTPDALDPIDDLEPLEDLEALAELEPPTTRWPTVIGTISILVAIGGLLCQAGMSLMGMFGDLLAKMGGMDFEMPLVLKVVSGINLVIMTILGVMLLVGGVKLLRRRAGGIVLLRRWALLRILAVVFGVIMTIATLPANIRVAEQGQEFANAQNRARERPDLVEELDDEALWRKTIVQTAIASGLACIYPVFITFYMGRQKIADEAKQWGG